MDNKITDNEIKVESEFGKKLENFWYYHKWHVIVAVFVALVFGFCVYSCLSKPKTDITLLYGGPFSSQNSSVPQMKQDLLEIMPESVGTNGAEMIILELHTAEQARKAAEKSVNEYIKEEEKYGRYYTDKERESLIEQQIGRYNSITSSSQTTFGSYMGIGRYSICLLDPSVYEKYRGMEIFVLLSDVFSDGVPESAYSEDAIKLCETKLYLDNPNGIGQLPEDTLICLRIEPIISGGCSGDNTENTEYQKAIEMFRAMAE